MNKIKSILVNHRNMIILCLFISLIFSFPLFNETINVGHDLLFHLSRIQGLKDQFEVGQFIAKIYPYHNYGFGYPGPLFYCDIFLYPAGLMYYLGVPLLISFKTLVFIFTVFLAFSMYSATYLLCKNKYASIISSTLYMFCTYHAIDVYTRSALGEILALTFLPLVICSIYKILVEEKDYSLLLGFMMACVVLSHNLSFVLACITILIFTLIYIKNIFKNPKIVIYLFKAALYGMFLSAFFLFPMLEQMLWEGRVLNINLVADKMDLNWFRNTITQIFMNSTMIGYANDSPLLFQKISINLGIILTICPFLIIFTKKFDDKKLHRFLVISLILGSLLLFMTSNLFNWDLLSFMTFLQFPWRLNIIISILFSFVAAIALVNFFEHINLKYITFFIIFISIINFTVLVEPVVSFTWQAYNDLVYEDVKGWQFQDPNGSGFKWNRNELADAEYLPYTDGFEYYKHSQCIYDISDENIQCDYQKNGNTMTFEIPSNNINKDIILPITAYKGYALYLLNDDFSINSEVDLNIYDKHQTISFVNERASASYYMLIYKGTIVQKISLYLSLITFIIMSILAIRYILKLDKKISVN